MHQHTTETVAQDGGWASRRRSLLALGGAGFLAAVAGHSTTEAKKKRKKHKKKKRKRCKREKRRCEAQVADYCLQFGPGSLSCELEIFPCCDACKVGNGVLCGLEIGPPFDNPPEP